MTCEQALEAMSAALDGELSAEERKELDEHLNTCPKCAALMKELSGQSLLLRQLDCDVPTGLDARILSALPEQPRPAKKGKIIHWRRWGTLAACLILALWGGSALTNGLRMGADAALNSMAAPPMMDAAPGDAANGSSSADAGGAEDRGGGSADPGEEAGDSVGGADPGEAASGDTAAKSSESGFDDFSAHFSLIPSGSAAGIDALYLRAQWSEGLDAPAAQLVSDADALAALAGSLGIEEDALANYGDAFFEEHQLIAVTLTENSGSVSHTVSGLEPTEDGWQVDILRSVPDIGTCDMAAWLILVETDLTVTDGDVLTVSIINE